MNRLSDDYFNRVYARAEDPWGFETRRYEQRKYALTLAMLPHEKYRRAFEPGCSFGVLTEMLAPRCASLVACELVPSVAERARRRLRKRPHVDVQVGAIPEAWPSGTFDLILLSEVLYYLTEEGASEIHQRLEASTGEGAHVIAVHYRGETDYPMSGDAVHALMRSWSGMRTLARYEEDSFLIDLFERSVP
jgi:trans-aconitate methyltransferase